MLFNWLMEFIRKGAAFYFNLQEQIQDFQERGEGWYQ